MMMNRTNCPKLDKVIDNETLLLSGEANLSYFPYVWLLSVQTADMYVNLISPK